MSRRRALFAHLSAVALFILPAGCATLPAMGGRDLKEEIRAVIDAEPLDQVHWGVLIVDPDRGDTLFSRNSHRKFIPASNMKVLSTATALSLLGPDFRFQSELWGVGTLDGVTGTLEGDLVLRAMGDPTLSKRFYPSATASLDSLAAGLWRSGIRFVNGALVVDASPWDSTTVPGSWEVGDLPGRSAATGGIFAIGEGEVVMEISAGPEIGAPATVTWWPATPPDFDSAGFTTAPPDSARRRTTSWYPESRRLRVDGRVPLGVADTLSIAQRDPAAVASGALYRALGARGIIIRDGYRMEWEEGQPLGRAGCLSGHLPATSSADAGGREETGPHLPHCSHATLLAALSSPPVVEIVEAILEPSQNWMTEQLVHALGFQLGEEGSWREGFRVEEEFLATQVGVDTLDLRLRDGSGLSAQNLVTPRAMVQILDFMRNSSNGEAYRRALAEPGEDPGTLRRRLPELEGRLFAKTGTISNVNSLSGYLTTESGRTLIFSILTNGSGLPSSTVRRGVDGIVQIVARR